MRILIFGGRGFVGTNLVNAINKYFEIFIPTRKVKELIKDKNITYLPFDIEKNLYDIKPDVVVNLIGILKEYKKITYEETHITIIEEIIKSMLKNNIKKIIHLSALGVGKNCNSKYFKTKEIAETKIINSGLNYLIIRPPIMLGKGQKLNEELISLSKLTPIIFAPNSITRVSSINETIREILDGIYGKIGIVEIKGKKVSYKELFEEILKSNGIKRIILEVPIQFFLPIVLLSSFLEKPFITIDTYKMLLCSKRIYE